MRLSFHGADRGVTGSCHMVECAGKRILIDCGLYQGGRELDEDNSQPFGFDPTSIDYVNIEPIRCSGRVCMLYEADPKHAGHPAAAPRCAISRISESTRSVQSNLRDCVKNEGMAELQTACFFISLK